MLCCRRSPTLISEHVWVSGRDILYLGGTVGVDGDHILDSLLDFELDVELPLQRCDALLVS